MGYREFDADGGESVFCINEAQRMLSKRLFEEGNESAEKLKDMLRRIELGLSRNEQAALAFEIIDRLLKTS